MHLGPNPRLGHVFCSDLLSGLFSLEFGEVADLDVLHERVELLLGILVFVSLARNSDAHAARHVPDPVDPDEAIQTGVNSDIL